MNVAFELAAEKLSRRAQAEGMEVVAISHEHVRHDLGIDDWVSTVTILAVLAGDASARRH